MTLKKTFIALYTIIFKEIIRITRIWAQTLIPPIITTTLYFIIFGQLIGSQVHPIAGFSFIEFIIPGLIMSSLLSNSYINTVSSLYGARFMRSIEEMLISPMPASVIICGFVIGGVFRGVVTALIIFMVSLLFVTIEPYNIFILLLVAILASILFSLLGFINGLFARNFDDTTWITNFIITPLTYLGGVFYSIDMLPALLQKITLFNPIFYIINGFRYGFLGIASSDVLLSIGIMLLLNVLIFALAIKCFYKAKV